MRSIQRLSGSRLRCYIVRLLVRCQNLPPGEGSCSRCECEARYIADTGNHRIQLLTHERLVLGDNTADTILGGVEILYINSDTNSYQPGCTPLTLRDPRAVVVDADGSASILVSMQDFGTRSLKHC